jgi:hypothetical protein
MSEDTNLQTETAVSNKPLHKAALEFVKEWGGFATVIIAVVYTFPFDIIDRYLRWEEYSVSESRKALTDASALLADQLMNTAKVSDWQTRFLLTNTYSSRRFNILVSHLDTFAKAKNKLRYSDLYTLGSMLSITYLAKEALPYYDSAIDKAKADNPLVLSTIYREKGNALFSLSQNISDAKAKESYQREARISYQEALDRLNPSVLQDQELYLMFLSELGLQELGQGDWKCGQDIIADTRAGLRAVSALDPSMAGIYQTAERQYAMTNKRATQSAEGCNVKYKVPQLEVGLVGLTGASVAAPSGSASDASQAEDLNSIFQNIPLGPPGRTLPEPLINGGALAGCGKSPTSAF